MFFNNDLATFMFCFIHIWLFLLIFLIFDNLTDVTNLDRTYKRILFQNFSEPLRYDWRARALCFISSRTLLKLRNLFYNQFLFFNV